jgi:hypothetical protein
LSLKFCPAPPGPTTKAELENESLKRFERDIDIRAWFNTPIEEDPDDPFNQNLYLRSDWEAPFIDDEIRHRKMMFRISLAHEFRSQNNQKPASYNNLTILPRRGLLFLQSNPQYLVVQCDKNLGPCVIDRDRYIMFAYRDHLSDHTTYDRLTPEEADQEVRNIKEKLKSWIDSFKDAIPRSEIRFLRRSSSLQQDESALPAFYLTLKIHKKDAMKTRPIVSCSGSILEGLGKWLDSQLQPIARAQRSHFKSSTDLKIALLGLTLPQGARLFTADATSMYTNIRTTEACDSIETYLRTDHPDLNVDAIISALRLIMTNNVFSFGDCFFKQKMGTAMGAPPAPPYATIFYGIHEASFLDDFQDVLLGYWRFIDDVLGIFIPSGDSHHDETRWRALQTRMNAWHGLEWTFTPLATSVDFMDLTIKVTTDNRITTTLFEKALNIYQYLTPTSAHPPGVVTGLVYGSIFRLYTLCSDPTDITSKLKLFYHRLRVRGWQASVLDPLFHDGICAAMKRLDCPTVTPDNRDKASKSDLFFHIKYNPLDPASRVIHETWQSHFAAPVRQKPINQVCKATGPDRRPYHYGNLTVAYHRQPNLGNLLSYRKIKPAGGPPVSSYALDDHRAELANLKPRSY